MEDSPCRWNEFDQSPRNGISVYIAMTYGADPERYTALAMDVFDQLKDLGYEPYCPHLCHFLHLRRPRPNCEWLNHVKYWMRRCDVMLRVPQPDESPGADEEQDEFSGPIFHSIDELQEWKKSNYGFMPPPRLCARIHYVVGLAFDPEHSSIVLIHKQTGPEAVIGRWNGLGGKMETNEIPEQAMAREFHEESGVDLPPDQWSKLGTLEAKEYVIHFLTATSSSIFDATTRENETVLVFPIDNLPSPLMPNIRWMILFAQDADVGQWGNIQMIRH